ncbi:MAG: SpoIIE family protein phosphatase, partial [bacterium]
MFKAAINEEIKVPAHIDYLGDLRNFVTKAGRKHNFPATVVNAFKLCIDEAATNIIKHAYRDWEGMITMRVIVKKNSMSVVLIDQGKYFDPSRVADPDLNRYVDIGKKGGLGIFIMRKLLDEIDYHHTEEGNELRLTKFRDSSFRKLEGEAPALSLSVSLKTKYSLITAAIVTIIVIVFYFFFFFIHGNKVFNEFVITEKIVCEDIARISLEEGAEELNIIYLESTMPDYIKDRKEIYRLIFTGQNDLLVYSTDEEMFYNQSEFKIPPANERLRPFLFRYKIKEVVNIYSFVSNINDKFGKTNVGKVYLEVKQDYVRDKIAAQRIKDLQAALIILLIGYGGTFVLVYFILNPFRKLANWVKELGSGNVKDEIDFDSSDEVGEIAQAFSEITDKFRESQRNLAEQERIQNEMQLAQDIQQTLLPAEVPEIEGYEIASHYEAAKEVGGDYFDFIQVDKDTLGIVVADVSGKGVPGSLVMTMIRTALRTEARSLKSASEVLARVNEFVVNDMKKGMFVTLFYVIVDSKKRRINYASAGHNPMILFRQGTKKTYYLNPRGFPVGISLPDAELFKKSIESDTIQLTEDDILLIYTDGITESMNNSREMFSEERLLDVIRKYGNLRAKEFIDKLKDEIHSFTEGYEQSDDITVVAIKERSTPEKIELNRAQVAHQMILNGKTIRDACEEAGITTYAYYNKYKKIFEEEGIDAYSVDETVSVEAKHLSIEEKTKIYDIIKKHPEYGAKRIAEELNTEPYGLTQINESRIYDELVRSRLNTRQLREAYIARSGKKKRMKAPGTPMLTLDGKIIISKDLEKFEKPAPKPTVRSEDLPVSEKQEKPVALKKQEEIKIPKDPDDNFYLESLVTFPIEDLLKKQRESQEEKEPQEELTESTVEETVEKEEVKDIDFLAEFEEEPAFEDIKSSELEDDELSIEKEIDEFEEAKEDVENIGIEHEFSFRDIWEEQDIDLSDESIDQKDIEDVKIVDEEEIKDQKKIEDGFGSSIKTSIDIDDVLEESEVDDIGFEMLTDDMSFKDDIFIESNGDNGKQSSEDEDFVPSRIDSTSVAISSDDLNEGKEDIEQVELAETKESMPLTKIDEDDILAEDEEYTVTEFSFNDLLEEIESDISFFDQDKSNLDEVEFAYATKSQDKKVRRMQKSEDC